MAQVAEELGPTAGAALIASALDDPESFRSLVDAYSQRLFRLAYRMTGNPQDAEELVQETFLRAYRARRRFEARANYATWLYRICVNAALDHLRRRAPLPPLALDDPDVAWSNDRLPGPAPTPERLLLSREMRSQIEAAMSALSLVERAAFAMRHYEQLSIEEIAAALGLRQGAAKNTIFRGVRKLRRALAPLVESSR
ncbi:MAG: RNA polymerase sigma factor [Terriglobales bacterium]